MKQKYLCGKSLIVAFLSVFIFIVALAGVAYSADTKKEYRKTPTGKGSLTPKMLRACIKMKKKLDQQSEDAGEENEELKALNEELESMAETIKESQEKLDQKDKASVDEHNKLVQTYTAKQEEYKQMVESYNGQIGQYKKMVKKFKKQCDGQPYYEDDYEKVSSEMGYGLK